MIIHQLFAGVAKQTWWVPQVNHQILLEYWLFQNLKQLWGVGLVDFLLISGGYAYLNVSAP